MLKFKTLLSLIFVSTALSAQVDPSKIGTTQKFDEVLMYVNRMYVDTVNDEQLTDAAIVALLEKLDPHSTYISKEEVDEANSSINGSFVGIGIRFQIMKDTLMVVATVPGGPSEKLGLLPGDKITKIENEIVAGIGLKNSQVRERLMGELGTKVKVEVIRKNAKKPLDFVITRDNIPINSVDAYYMITPEIGYLKLNSFSRSTVDEIQKGIIDLKSKGMKHLIFDLQGNGGGLLDAAQKVADEFLSGDKLIVYSEGRAQPRTNLKAGKKGLWEDGSLIVLTDEYSASASEIVSGAIQDWDRGMVIGRRSYGKGLVQRPIDLTDGSQVRLTIARYYTPTGRWIQKPYDDPEAYKNDLTQLYLTGEFQHVDSIKLPDSLKYQTMITKRTVYGGGGIMPDIFVPIDTTYESDYLNRLFASGSVNQFSYDYVDQHRNELKKFSSPAAFRSGFKADQAFINEFTRYAEIKGVPKDEKGLQQSLPVLSNQLKAYIARLMWRNDGLYPILHEKDPVLQRALQQLKKEK